MNEVEIDVSGGKSMVAALRSMGEVALLPQEFLHTSVGLEQMAYAFIALGENTHVVMGQPDATMSPLQLNLFGIVVDRIKRAIRTMNNNSTAEIVTYTIQDTAGRRFFVDDYSPEEYYEFNEYVEVSVYAKTFKKQTGDIGYSFYVQTQDSHSCGEHF